MPLLSEIAQIVDCEHKTAPATQSATYAYSVGTRALAGDSINLDQCKPVDEETYLEWSRRAILEDGDIVFAREAPIGGVGLVQEGQRFCLGQRTVMIRAKRDLVLPRYLYYFLKSAETQARLHGLGTGSTVQHVNVADVRNFEVPELPSLVQQAEIADTLWALDRKVWTNSSLSKTLESIAQTLFRSWFVDFDPVRAKMAGEKPAGMDDPTAALFPDSMVETELGDIPAGWSMLHFQDLMGLVTTKVSAGEKSTALPYVPIDQIDSKSLFLKRWLPGENAKTSLISFEKGDLLFGAMRPYFHKVCLAPFEGTTRSTAFVFRAKNPNKQLFCLLSLYQEATIEFATNHSSGSTIPYAVWRNSLENFLLVTPPEEVLVKFQALVETTFHLGYSLMAENSRLAEIRDALLPRLISGELEVPESLLVS